MHGRVQCVMMRCDGDNIVAPTDHELWGSATQGFHYEQENCILMGDCE